MFRMRNRNQEMGLEGRFQRSRAPAWNYSKEELGGVIFGCTKDSINECLSNLLFGLPSIHSSYVENIEPGLPLFLFNYDDRKLHGIYEAASCGQMNINPNAWTENGSSKTQYPAQVHVGIRKQCHYLLEEQYSEIIEKNYYTQFHYRLAHNHKQIARRFRFELDHMQTAQLLSLFESSPLTHSSATFYSNASNMRPLLAAASNLDTKHEDEDLEKSAVDVSSKLCMKYRVPAMVPFSERKWIPLYRENFDSDARSEGDDIVSLVSESNCLNNSNMDSGPSGITPYNQEETWPSDISPWWEKESGLCREKETGPPGITPSWEEEKEVSWNVPSCWEEEAGPLGVTTLGKEGMSSGIATCLGQEKQIFETQSDKEAMDEEERIYSKLKQLAFKREKLNLKVCREDVNVPKGMDNSSIGDELSPAAPSANEKDISKSEEDIEGAFESYGTNNSGSEDIVSTKSPSTSENYEDLSIKSSYFPFVIDQLRQEIEEVKAFSIDQNRKASVLEKNLVDSENLIQQLRHRIVLLESHLSNPSSAGVEVWNGSGCNELFTESFDEPCLGHGEDIWIMGGFDGVSWLQTMDCYSPSRDCVKSLAPMSSARSYASAAVLNGLIYSFGGWNGYDNLWYDTVECYSPTSNKWSSCFPLSEMKGCLAGATLNNKLYAVGGGNGKNCFRTVEMFDPVLGRWIVTQSMLQK
ncbi:Development/cell death domain, Galactose oxidase, beta-propeller, partial [Thalictrum thalictroides]